MRKTEENEIGQNRRNFINWPVEVCKWQKGTLISANAR